MALLLCPYCPQTYEDVVHLAAHVHRTHRDAANPIDRAIAVSEARTVADVDVTSPALIEPEPQHETPCFCGLPLVLADADTEYPSWSHEFPPPKCRAAVPAAGLATMADREALVTATTQSAEALAAVRKDLQSLSAQLTDVADTLDRAEAATMRPDAVRRMTLSQVLDKLLDGGHMAAYETVSKMLRGAS